MDYDLNEGTRYNIANLFLNISIHQFPNTFGNAIPNEVASSRAVNSFKHSLDKHWAENPQMSELTAFMVAIIDAVHSSRVHKQS